MKKELNELETKKNGELKELDVALKYGTRNKIFWGIDDTICDKIELREKQKKE